MSRHGRLGRIERTMKLSHGPSEACPSCQGRGTVEQIDGERTGARLAHRVALVNAKHLGTPEPGPLALPDEPQQVCYSCRGTGRRPRAVVEALAMIPDHSTEQLTAKLTEVAHRLSGHQAAKD